MNRTKVISKICAIVFFGGLLAAIIADNVNAKDLCKSEPASNFRFVEQGMAGGFTIRIIEIHSHLYIYSGSNYMIHAEHCPCKTK